MQTEPATLMFMPRASLKGRGTVWAIEHRFTSQHHQSVDDGWGLLDQAAREEALAPVQGHRFKPDLVLIFFNSGVIV